MQSFVDIDHTFADQPRELGAVLARIDTGRGREALFEDQAPELLMRLSEHARIASITASNAIEGVLARRSGSCSTVFAMPVKSPRARPAPVLAGVASEWGSGAYRRRL